MAPWLPSGAMQKRFSVVLENASLIPDDAKATHGQESKRVKLAMLSGWEGWHTVNRINTSQSWVCVSSWMWTRVDSAFLCVCYCMLSYDAA